MAIYGYKNISSNFPLDEDFDIRESIRATIYGSEYETPKGRWIVLQRLKRDINGDPIRSPHTYKMSGEGSVNDRGTATTRTGYLCDELWIRAIMVPSGRLALAEMQSPIGNIDTNRMVFYTSDKVMKHDIYIVPNTDAEGKVLKPVSVELMYEATIPYEKRLDNGRVEFYMMVAEVQK